MSTSVFPLRFDSDDLKEKLKNKAAKERMSMNSYILKLIEKDTEENE